MDLRQIALNTVGGTYLKVDEVISKYPDGVTVTGAFMRGVREGKVAPCFRIAESASEYFFAVSGDLGKLFEAWLTAHKDLAELDANLKKTPQKIKIFKVKQSNGKTYVKAEIVVSG